uniref:Uncharacterized protein n=1 Tax=Cacopsylla melanoneura TaxID=428564 RepID=A0A8D8QYP6_9HEMI
MGASRLQRWALVLSEFDYSLQYIKGNSNLADWFSRFPQSDVDSEVEDKIYDYVNFVQNPTPIDFQEFLGRKVRTPFDFIKEGDSFDKQGAPDSAGLLGRRQVSFCSGEKVYVRCYQDQSRVKWVKGTIVKKIGKVVYLVRLDDGAVVKRHLDQIVQYDSSENCSSRALLFDDLDVSQPANTDTNVPSDSDVLQPTDRDTIDSHDGDAIDSHDSNVSLTSPSNDTPSFPSVTLTDVPVEVDTGSGDIPYVRPRRNCGPPSRLTYSKLGG